MKDWKDFSEDSREKYQLYLCSREWAEKRQAIIDRASGICERCGRAPISDVHHLTYERKYAEDPADLAGFCEWCHSFTHGKLQHDPCKPPNFDAITTGLRDVDHAIGGMRAGAFLVVSGASGVGKTSFAMTVASNLCAAEAKVALLCMHHPRRQVSTYVKGAEVLGLDGWSPTTAEIETAVLRCGNPDVVIVDCIQDARSVSRSRGEDVAECLKSLAMRMSIPVLATSRHPGWKMKDRYDRRPVQTDADALGAITQIADLVAFVDRAFIYDKSANVYDAELVVLKNRFGPATVAPMVWDERLRKFSDWNQSLQTPGTESLEDDGF
jgi:hypothetical protein